MDDVATGGTREEVDRMAGVCIGGRNKFETNGTLSQILSEGSLKLKAVVTSGEQNMEKIAKLGKFVLGLGWDPSLDIISIDVRESECLKSILSTNNLSETHFTPRILLGIINCPHDVLGLVSPITIQAMVAY